MARSGDVDRVTGRQLGPRRRRRRPGPTARLLAGVGPVLYLLLGVVVLASAGPSGAQGQDGSDDDTGSPRALATELDGTVTPVVAEYIGDVIARGEDEGYDVVVIEMDTPGGLEASMRDIIQRILGSEVPVVVYVSPEGARATSAGALIAFSAHVAAMAPATSIGAATPVDLAGGEDLSDADRKAVNDAAGLATSLADRRDRNPDFAEDTVREGRSASAAEALDLGAVDISATSLEGLLDEIDGWTVEVGPDDETVTLDTAGAEVDTMEMGLFRQVQQFLADPNLAFLFLSIGTLGIIYELASGGVSGAGVVGGVLVVLALFSLAVLPVNVVGLLLLALAAGLFVAELFAPGIGVAAAGGAVTLALGGIFMFRDAPGFDVSSWVLAPVALVVGGAVVIAGRLVVRSERQPSTASGTGLYIGQPVTVQDIDGDRGRAFIGGAWWRVRPDGDRLLPGPARVVDVDGLTLVVAGEETDNPQEPPR